MSTITMPTDVTTRSTPARPPAFVVIQGGDQSTVFPGVDWHTYNQLSQAIGESGGIRLIYDGRHLEIMVVGNIHDYYKDLLGAIVRAVATGTDVDFVACGQTTWQTMIRGLEADLSYYFLAGKISMARAALARLSRDSTDYPRPDLAIEIDMSPPQVDRGSIYRELGVAEVWRLVDGRELVLEQLQPDGSYTQVEKSRFLAVTAADVMRWVNDAATEHQAKWNRRLIQWAMTLRNEEEKPA